MICTAKGLSPCDNNDDDQEGRWPLSNSNSVRAEGEGIGQEPQKPGAADAAKRRLFLVFWPLKPTCAQLSRIRNPVRYTPEVFRLPTLRRTVHHKTSFVTAKVCSASLPLGRRLPCSVSNGHAHPSHMHKPALRRAQSSGRAPRHRSVSLLCPLQVPGE